MHGPINVKSPNNISEWLMGINSAFKGLRRRRLRGTTFWIAGSGVGVKLATGCGMPFEIQSNILV
jgi:hypothetical protein